MKKLVFSFLTVLFAVSAMATEPMDKLPAIVIDTIYMSSGTLVIEYEVFRPFDKVSLSVQASRSMALRDADPITLSGNIGKGKTSAPVSIIQSSLKS